MPLYSVEEIFSQVIQAEKDGAEFYHRLAKEARLPAARDIFRSLADDELRHQKDFAALAKTINGQGFSFESSINLTELMVTMKEKLLAVMKGSELVDMEEANLKQVLDIGIHNEHEAIRIYSELLTFKHPDFAEIITKVIGEERKHLAALEKLKAQRLS